MENAEYVADRRQVSAKNVRIGGLKMIKPAQLYKEELEKKMYEQWYKPETSFYSGLGNSSVKLKEDNYDTRQYVSVDKDNNVIGYIAHDVDWIMKTANHFGMISFDKGNLTFAIDLYEVITNLFCKEKFNRVEWRCFTDNPAVRGYKKLIDRIGGRIAGTLHNTCVFPDGSMHDSYIFEILKEDLKLKKG